MVQNDRLTRYRNHVAHLLQHLPAIHELIHPQQPIEQLDGWSATQRRYVSLCQQGERPALVATLYGPSGAGKSTIFRLLTGIEVPIGVVRPCTRAAIAAVPPAMNEPVALGPLFPQFEVEPLHDQTRLAEVHTGVQRLFIAPSQPPTGVALPYVLADVPDFNSVEKQNWERAEQMLRRAEVVLFTVYGEGYADERTVQELARCCRLAGRMALIITKVTSGDSARAIRQSLPELLLNGRHASIFQQRRADGRTLAEFLDESPTYYVPHLQRPLTLDDIGTLDATVPPLLGLLGGFEAESIILAGLMEPAAELVLSARPTLLSVSSAIRQTNAQLEVARGPLAEAAGRVAGEEFPIGRFFELVISEVLGSQSSVVERVWSWGTRAISTIYTAAKDFVAQLNKGQTGELKPHIEQERKHLAAQGEALFDRWRLMFPSEADHGILDSEAIPRVRVEFQKCDLPAPSIHWEDHVRAAARAWASAHPWLRRSLPLIVPALAAGLAVMAVPSSAIGAIVAAGVGGMAGGGLLTDLIIRLQLQGTLEKASTEWRTTRREQVLAHLERELYAPLFQPWTTRRDALLAAPVGECLLDCDALDDLRQTSPEPELPLQRS